MEKIFILYIDDNLDTHTIEYLNEIYTNPTIEKFVTELEFNAEKDNYENLLDDSDVKKADIIIIDSKLFQNSSAGDIKLSGEEFRMIIKRFFPYKEIIVITQNDIIPEFDIVPKFDSRRGISAGEFYDKQLRKKLDEAIKSIISFRTINKKLKTNNNIDSILIEKIDNNLYGILEYDGFTKQDLDKLISSFEEIKEQLGHV